MSDGQICTSVRLWKILDAKQQTTEYGYDGQGRLETITYADGKIVTLSYDADGNLSGYSDGETSGIYTYDDMGRKLTETVNYPPTLSGFEGFSKSFEFTYYGNGQKHTFTTPDGMVYTYHYGDNNELRQVQIPGVGSLSIPEYAWNRPATINYPGDTQRTYTYDALMRTETLLVATAPDGHAHQAGVLFRSLVLRLRAIFSLTNLRARVHLLQEGIIAQKRPEEATHETEDRSESGLCV